MKKVSLLLILVFFTAIGFANPINSMEEKSDDVCTVSISVTVSVGVGRNYVSATLKAQGVPCAKVKEMTEELRQAASQMLELQEEYDDGLNLLTRGI